MKRAIWANTVLTVALAIGFASPAYAHGSEAKNTESVIDSVTPQVDGLSVAIAAGDSFMVVKADKGHTVEIHGYSDEPYLRVLTDGTVEENRNSPAVLLNKSRFGDVGSADLDPTLEPDWHVVARDGEIAWHDHRIHWMGESTPPTIDDNGTVQKWSVMLVVDNAKVEVTGRLVLLDQPSIAWWLLAVPFGLLVFVPARRKLLLTLLLILGATLLAFDIWRMMELPQVGRHVPTVGIAGAVTAVLAMIALLNRREKYADALLAGVGTAACLAVYVGVDWMTKAIIPGIGAEWLARAALAKTLGAGAVALYVGVNGVLKISRQ